MLPASPSNKERHETLQRFMLINDSVTLAVEIPVYLTVEVSRIAAAEGFGSISMRKPSPNCA